MEKKDLKTGMLAQVENGDWFVIIDEKMFNLKDMCYVRLVSFTDNMECVYCSLEEFSIVKIATVEYIGDIFRAYKENKLPTMTIIWERELSEETQLNTLINDLKEHLAEAQTRLANIKK